MLGVSFQGAAPAPAPVAVAAPSPSERKLVIYGLDFDGNLTGGLIEELDKLRRKAAYKHAPSELAEQRVFDLFIKHNRCLIEDMVEELEKGKDVRIVSFSARQFFNVDQWGIDQYNIPSAAAFFEKLVSHLQITYPEYASNIKLEKVLFADHYFSYPKGSEHGAMMKGEAIRAEEHYDTYFHSKIPLAWYHVAYFNETLASEYKSIDYRIYDDLHAVLDNLCNALDIKEVSASIPEKFKISIYEYNGKVNRGLEFAQYYFHLYGSRTTGNLISIEDVIDFMRLNKRDKSHSTEEKASAHYAASLHWLNYRLTADLSVSKSKARMPVAPQSLPVAVAVAAPVPAPVPVPVPAPVAAPILTPVAIAVPAPVAVAAPAEPHTFCGVVSTFLSHLCCGSRGTVGVEPI